MGKCYFDLNDKIAIITGGGTGIGKGIAIGLAEAGATVILCGRRLSICEEACHAIKKKTGAQAYPGGTFGCQGCGRFFCHPGVHDRTGAQPRQQRPPGINNHGNHV